MSKPHRAAAVAGALLIAAAAVGSAGASSHREAPLISKDPTGDNTDTYAFIPPNKPDHIVLAASWIPFEAPEGGPNYWEWNDEYSYQINVSNDGDPAAEVVYELTSETVIKDPDTFLYNTGPLTTLGDPNWNRVQKITVTETINGGTPTVLIDDMRTAPSNVGIKSVPDFRELELQATRTMGTGANQIKVYGGQTDDAFFVDLQVFDLLTLRGQAPPIGYSGGANLPQDSLSGFNVHTLAVQVPISRVTAGTETVLGVWSTTRDETDTQISRLGMPLTNEVVLPMSLKDTFNSIAPSQDLGVYSALQESVEDPEIGNLLCGLYGVPLPDSGGDCETDYVSGTPRTGRGDIFDIFLTGMVLENPFTIETAGGPMTLPAGFNINRPAGVVPSEMLRINTAIKGDTCKPTPSRLGVLGGDACGFPNGRRLFDDVVEIELLAVAGAAYEALDDSDSSFSFNPALIGVLTDGVNRNDKDFRPYFPYFAQAQSGKTHHHQNQFAVRIGPR
ncbi:MAG: DUF4331 domain-containing protein [Chloroflexi bacterium]|nr:DUF4331 domain-containing protein [Chloroflexota bacterium]